MGLMLFGGAISAMFLPETLGQRLPETMAEAKEFGRGQPFWGVPKSNIVHVKKDESGDEMENGDVKEKLNQPEFAP